VENFILTGNIAETVPIVQMEDGSTEIVDYYLWTKSSLSSKLKVDLHSMCSKYGLKLSDIKHQFVDRLLNYRTEIMKSFVTNSLKKNLYNENNVPKSKQVKKLQVDLPSIDTWNEDNLTKLTLRQLQDLCKQFHLKQVKMKKTMIAHLLEYKSAHINSEFFISSTVKSNFDSSTSLLSFKGKKAIGKRVRVFWKKENQTFEGTVIDFQKNSEDYLIKYDDGFELWGHFLEDLDFIDAIKKDSNKIKSNILTENEVFDNMVQVVNVDNLQNNQIILDECFVLIEETPLNLQTKFNKDELKQRIAEEELQTTKYMSILNAADVYFANELNSSLIAVQGCNTEFFDDVLMNAYMGLLSLHFKNHAFISTLILAQFNPPVQQFSELNSKFNSIFTMYNSKGIHWDLIHIQDKIVYAYESLSNVLLFSDTFLEQKLNIMCGNVSIKWIVLKQQVDGHSCGPLSIAYLVALLLNSELDLCKINIAKHIITIKQLILQDLVLFHQKNEYNSQLVSFIKDILVQHSLKNKVKRKNNIQRKSERTKKPRTLYSPLKE
jgi:hypothetical protein